MYMSKEQFLKSISDFSTMPSLCSRERIKKELHIPYISGCTFTRRCVVCNYWV